MAGQFWMLAAAAAEPKGEQTWRKLSVPYFTTAGTSLIEVHGHLTIEPGVIIEMGEGIGGYGIVVMLLP